MQHRKPDIVSRWVLDRSVSCFIEKKSQNSSKIHKECKLFLFKKPFIFWGKALREFFWYPVSLMPHFFLGTELLTINNLLFKAQIDNINLFKVVSKNHDAVLIHSGCRLLSRFIILILVTEVLWEEPDQQKGMGVVLYECWLLDEINVPPLHLQLGGFVEKYAGSGVTLHPQSSSNKENRRTEGLNRYLQTLQSHQSTATGISRVIYGGYPFSQVLIEI